MPAASTTHRVIRGALILLSTQPVTWAASLLLVIFVPRLLDSRALGEYQMAVSLEGVLIALLSLGVPSVLTRRIASSPETASARPLDGPGAAGWPRDTRGGPGPAGGPRDRPAPGLDAAAGAGADRDGADPVPDRAALGPDRVPADGRFAWSNAVTAVSTALLAILFISLGGGNLGFVAAAAWCRS